MWLRLHASWRGTPRPYRRRLNVGALQIPQVCAGWVCSPQPLSSVAYAPAYGFPTQGAIVIAKFAPKGRKLRNSDRQLGRSRVFRPTTPDENCCYLSLVLDGTEEGLPTDSGSEVLAVAPFAPGRCRGIGSFNPWRMVATIASERAFSANEHPSEDSLSWQALTRVCCSLFTFASRARAARIVVSSLANSTSAACGMPGRYRTSSRFGTVAHVPSQRRTS